MVQGIYFYVGIIIVFIGIKVLLGVDLGKHELWEELIFMLEVLLWTLKIGKDKFLYKFVSIMTEMNISRF